MLSEWHLHLKYHLQCMSGSKFSKKSSWIWSQIFMTATKLKFGASKTSMPSKNWNLAMTRGKWTSNSTWCSTTAHSRTKACPRCKWWCRPCWTARNTYTLCMRLHAMLACGVPLPAGVSPSRRASKVVSCMKMKSQSRKSSTSAWSATKITTFC